MIIGCYARLSLQGDAKNVSMFQKYSFFFCPAADIISVENTTSLHPLSRQGQNVFFFTLRP